MESFFILLYISLKIRAGIRLKLSKDALIKVLDYCIRINKKFIRKKLDFHACDFLGLEALQLTGLRTRALGPASWTPLDMKKTCA